MTNKGHITPRQSRAIPALLTEESIEAAAARAKISRRTLDRWLKEDDQFQTELHKAQDRAIDRAISRLAGEARAAAATLAEIHRDREVAAAVRVQAARAVLSEIMKLREQRELASRIERLEERLGI